MIDTLAVATQGLISSAPPAEYSLCVATLGWVCVPASVTTLGGCGDLESISTTEPIEAD